MATKKKSTRKAQPLDDPQELYRKIGKRIKQLRIEAGYTNAEKFAFQHEITRSQYANWEKGQDMKVSSLIRIMSIHNITLAEFFEGID
jgi:transcriptional regulator with XRE-family HTH domain